MNERKGKEDIEELKLDDDKVELEIDDIKFEPGKNKINYKSNPNSISTILNSNGDINSNIEFGNNDGIKNDGINTDKYAMDGRPNTIPNGEKNFSKLNNRDFPANDSFSGNNEQNQWPRTSYGNKNNFNKNKDSKRKIPDETNQKNSNNNLRKKIKNKFNKKNSNPVNQSKDGLFKKSKNQKRSRNLINKGKSTLKSEKKSLGKKILSLIVKHPLIALVILLVIVIIAILMLCVVPAFAGTITPGRGNDYSVSNNFSDIDQETLKDLNSKIVLAGNPNNAELALFIVAYPYYESLQDGSIDPYINKNIELNDEEKSKFDEWKESKREEILESFGCDDMCRELLGDSGINRIIKEYAKEYVKDKIVSWFRGEDDDEDEDAVSSFVEDEDDPYLKLFRKGKYKSKFKELLSKLNKSAKDGDYSLKAQQTLYEYLKTDYFKSDAGYKSLLLEANDENALMDAMISDISENAGMFSVYIGNNCVTSGGSTTPLNSAGNVKNIKGDIYVTLRDYFADSDGTFRKSSYYDSPVLYNTDSEPLTFARYIMGVVYAESEQCLNYESCAKSLMITAKSYAIGRQTSMDYDTEYIESEDKSIIHMRGNVGDQDFCDVYEGCVSGKFSKGTWQVFTGEGYDSRKGALSSDKLANLEKWWNDIADQYIINKESGVFSGNQKNDTSESCKQGSCVSQLKLLNASKKENDYMNLLFNPSNGGFDNERYVLYTSSTDKLYAVSTGSEVCGDSTATASRQKIVDFARSMVGKIPYYYYEGNSSGSGALGHAISKNFDDNHFGELTDITDHKGRNKYGLDCSGFVDFVFWNALDDNLGNGNTDTLKGISKKIEYSEIKPGDLGFLNDGSSGTAQHVGIYIGDDKWVELNPNGVTEGPYPDFKVYYRPNILAELDAKEDTSQGNSGEVYKDINNGIQGKFFAPVQKNIAIGRKDADNGYKNHDLEASCGTDLYSPADGKATFKTITKDGKIASYGNEIEINTSDGYRIILGHLESFVGYKTSYGSKSNYPSSCAGGNCQTKTYGTREVKKGEKIGTTGTSGNSSGCHLHIEVYHNNERLEPSDLFGYKVK